MTLGRGYFAGLYAKRDDPWHFAERWYERRKRALTLAALSKPRYASGFEPGCSVGVLTAELATRCDALLATDLDPRACASARRRVAHLPQVSVEQRSVPGDWPAVSFDLIVISELAYYFNECDLAALIAKACASLLPGGTLLVCHWRHPVEEYPCTGDHVHAAFARGVGRRHMLHYEDEDFLLDTWSDDRRSVASVEGLV